MDERIFDIVEKVEMIAVGVDGGGNAIAQFDQDANLEEEEEDKVGGGAGGGGRGGGRGGGSVKHFFKVRNYTSTFQSRRSDSIRAPTKSDLCHLYGRAIT